MEYMRREHARERCEIRDNEWDIRDGENARISMFRENMTVVLSDPKIESEARKAKLAALKEEIEKVMDVREERERNFIDDELKRHEIEQALEKEIEEEERVTRPKPISPGNRISILQQARSSLTVGAEQLRKTIEENRKELNEDEQFSTILINSSERENIPSFKKSRRKRDNPPEQPARIDTVVIKQREIGQMYRESQELQLMQLRKSVKKIMMEPSEGLIDEPQDEPIEESVYETGED